MNSSDIKGVEQVESLLGKWSPSDLAMIEGVSLKSNLEGGVTTLVLQALFQAKADSWPDFDKEMIPVTICFNDVGNLHLKGFGGGAVQIMGFDIRFVGDRGLEGINYEIEDYEDDRIRFQCRSVEVQSAG